MAQDSSIKGLTGPGGFPSTHWSIVLAAGRANEGAQALEELCRTYWPPLYAFLRRKGHSPQDAEDLVQSFLARLLAREDLAAITPEKGRFRTFLLTSLRNHSIKQALHHKAQKRGGGNTTIPIDGDATERLCGPDLKAENPEQAFDRRWASTLLARALQRLRQEQRARGKEAEFEALAPLLDGVDPGDYEQTGARLGMLPGTVAVAVHRLRTRLGVLLRAEVAQTVGSPDQIENELNEVMTAWTK